MPGIKRHRKIRAAALFVGRIDGWVQRCLRCALIAATRTTPGRPKVETMDDPCSATLRLTSTDARCPEGPGINIVRIFRERR
jgi:hypothetical protein